jgi:20S proteasome subunit alpha 6
MWENEDVDMLLRAWRVSRGEPEDGVVEETPAAAEGAVPAEEAQAAQGSEAAPPGAPAAGEDVTMEE